MSLEVGLCEASSELRLLLYEGRKIECALTSDWVVGRIDLFTESVDLPSDFFLSLSSGHRLRLDGRHLRNVDSTPPEVGEVTKVWEVGIGAGEEMWVLDYAWWCLGRNWDWRKWCEVCV